MVDKAIIDFSTDQDLNTQSSPGKVPGIYVIWDQPCIHVPGYMPERAHNPTCKDFEQIASYVGKLNIKHSSPDGVNTDSLVLGSTFIIGGQIRGQDLELYMVYPQGNFIRPADSKPYLVIGEVKYGKPILDRVITPNVSIGDASRCALISMDSTLKSDLTVGPPIDFAVYKKDTNKIASLKCLNTSDEDYYKVCNQWSDKVVKLFDTFPRFDWEI